MFYYIGSGFTCFVLYGLYRLVKKQGIANLDVGFVSLPQDSSPILFESDPRAAGLRRLEFEQADDITEKRGAS